MARTIALSCVLALVCSLVFVNNVRADDGDDIGFEQGEWELQLSGSGSSDEDFESNTVSFDLGLNFFFVDQLSIGFDAQGSTSSTEDDTSNSWGVGGALDYNIPLGPVQPFIGVTFGYLFGDALEETFYAGPEGGLKIFLNDDAYIYGSVQYQFLFEDNDDFGDNADDGRFWYGLGVGLTFGGSR